MSTQAEWEHELLAYAARLEPQHLQYLAQVHAAQGPAGVIQALAGTGLSRGALEVAASTIDEAGFEGAVQVTQGRLQEIATVNVERRSGEWLAENGINPDPNAASPAQQVAALHQAAKQQGIAPVEVARRNGLIYDAAVAAAQAVREKRPPGQPTKMQRLLELPDLHRSAAAAGMTGAKFLAKLQELSAAGDFEEIDKQSPGLFKDKAEARGLLEAVSGIAMTDRLVAELGERDGEGPKRPVADPDSWDAALNASWDKAQPRAQREARPPSEAPETADDDWGLNAAWDRAGGGPELDSGTVSTPDAEAA